MCDPTHLLDEGVDRLIVQFSLGTKMRLSSWLPSEKTMAPTERGDRKLPPGIQIVAPTHNVRISGIPASLRGAGFFLTDALEMPRYDEIKPERVYYVARFIFIRQQPTLSPEWQKLLDEIVAPSFDRLCDESCWRTRVFRNPVHMNGEIAPGRARFSLNFDLPSAPDMHEDKVRGTLGIADNAIMFIPRAA